MRPYIVIPEDVVAESTVPWTAELPAQEPVPDQPTLPTPVPDQPTPPAAFPPEPDPHAPLPAQSGLPAPLADAPGAPLPRSGPPEALSYPPALPEALWQPTARPAAPGRHASPEQHSDAFAHPGPLPPLAPEPPAPVPYTRAHRPYEDETVVAAPLLDWDGEPPLKDRRRRPVAAIAGAAVAAVALGAGLLGLALLGDEDEHDGALPEVRMSKPIAVLPTGDGPIGPSASTRSKNESASAKASRSGSASATASKSAERKTGSEATKSAGPTAAATTGSDTIQDYSSSDPVLSEGMSGGEVSELQRRLIQVGFYSGPVDGQYDGDVRDAVASYQFAHRIRGDRRGVYGKHTRRDLESRTG